MWIFVVSLAFISPLDIPPLTHVLSHAFLPSFMNQACLLPIHTWICDSLVRFGSLLVNLGGLGVKSYSDTCMHSHGLQGLKNILQFIINMYHTHLQGMLWYNG